MNAEAIERATKILARVKQDLARAEAMKPSEYRERQLSQLRDQLAKREAVLAELTSKSRDK